MYYTYILYSKSADRYYIGSTSDTEARLKKHNFGGTSSTRPYQPWVVVYIEEFKTRTEAIQRENSIKRKKSRKYIEGLVESSSAG